jgi:hypothetical protein
MVGTARAKFNFLFESSGVSAHRYRTDMNEFFAKRINTTKSISFRAFFASFIASARFTNL